MWKNVEMLRDDSSSLLVSIEQNNDGKSSVSQIEIYLTNKMFVEIVNKRMWMFHNDDTFR